MSSPDRRDVGRKLLFGLLAFRNNFIDRAALLSAFDAWAADKSRSLGDLLVECGALSDSRRALLDALVDEHLRLHGDDPAQSLTDVDVAVPVYQTLASITDPDLHASLAHIPADTRDGHDSDSTRTWSAGQATSAGARFHILHEHAKGGLGVVSVALDSELNRRVALKEIREEKADRPELRARFEAEAEITGKLEHPGIVPVYGLGHDAEGRPFYAMRFIQGESLKTAIKRFHGPDSANLPPGERAVQFRELMSRFLDVCNAIAYAHSRGVLHRDLKPGNVMLGHYGETLVVDWGLAKATGHGEPTALLTDGPIKVCPAAGSTPTLAGEAIGTPSYMSPEQAAGRLDLLGTHTDIFGLGATLYCLLTGTAPVKGRDTAQVLIKVQRGEIAPPRQVRAEVPRALEAICLTAMALKPEGRYASANDLAADLKRWLADEPVSAWREPCTTRARRWTKRHHTLVTASTAAALVALLAGGYLLNEARLRAAQRWTRAEGLVTALEAAQVREVPRLVEQLAPDRRLIRARLQALAQTKSDEPNARRRRLHAALALLPNDPDQAKTLADFLLAADARPDELLVIRQALRDQHQDGALVPKLWGLLDKPDKALTDSQFRAAAALALFAPDDRNWPGLAPRVAAKLVEENPLLIDAWREAFQPVSGPLSDPLRAIYAGTSRLTQRDLAFSVLFEFADRPGNPRQSEDLADLLADADPPSFRLALGQIRDRGKAIARLTQPLSASGRLDEAESRRQGQRATALYVLGRADRVWPLLKHSDDPSVRSELIEDLAKFGASPDALARRLSAERDVSTRRALLLALGGFPIERIDSTGRPALVATLFKWYRDDPDPGIHGSVEWLLRQRWGRAADLDGIDKELASPVLPKGRDWYVNGQGQSFAVVPGPVEFLMGSPIGEAGRNPNEVRHLRRIERSFAIAAKEVTVAQYKRFLEQTPDVANHLENDELKAFIPSADCPILAVDWYDAARYCNWLSAREGLPESQWCYPKQIKPGMLLRSECLAKVGYRLPTEAEWEYACRAGSSARRPQGASDRLLGPYAWYLDTASNASHPVGQKKPNDFGLFDLLGNAYEWSHNRYVPYRPSHDEKPVLDITADEAVDDSIACSLRGDGFFDQGAYIRPAQRFADRPSGRVTHYGFRVARTYR